MELSDFLSDFRPTAREPKPSIMIALFTGVERAGWLHPDILKFLSAVGQSQRKTTILTVNKRPVTAARNFAAAEFEKSGLDWLCCLDNDNTPAANVLELIDAADPLADIVTPRVYAATKRSDFTLMWVPITETDSNGWRELALTGTGCMMIRRRAFAKMTAPYFEFGKHGTDPLLEDEQFCAKARAAGVRIFGNVRYSCSHFKTFDLADLAARFGTVDCRGGKA